MVVREPGDKEVRDKSLMYTVVMKMSIFHISGGRDKVTKKAKWFRVHQKAIFKTKALYFHLHFVMPNEPVITGQCCAHEKFTKWIHWLSLDHGSNMRLTSWRLN